MLSRRKLDLRRQRDTERQAHLRRLQVHRMRIGQPPLDDLRNAERHAGDVADGEFVLLAQLQHRVDAGRDPRRRRVRLHQHVHQMEALAQPLLDQRRLETVGIGAGKAALPFDDVVRPAVALRRKQRRGNAALGRVRGVDALGRAAGIVELRQAAGVAAGKAQRVGDLSRGDPRR